MEPSTFLSSSINTAIKLAEFGCKLNDAKAETRDFCGLIQRVNRDLNETRRLRRTKESCMDTGQKSWIEGAIADADKILREIGETVEDCRVDLETKKTVGLERRFMWVLSKHGLFLSKHLCLSECHQRLLTCITIMHPMVPPPEGPPSYTAVVGSDVPLRSPSARRKMALQESLTLVDTSASKAANLVSMRMNRKPVPCARSNDPKYSTHHLSPPGQSQYLNEPYLPTKPAVIELGSTNNGWTPPSLSPMSDDQMIYFDGRIPWMPPEAPRKDQATATELEASTTWAKPPTLPPKIPVMPSSDQKTTIEPINSDENVWIAHQLRRHSQREVWRRPSSRNMT